MWEDLKKFMGTMIGFLVTLLLGLLVLVFAFRLLFLTFVDNYEVAYKYDLRVGKIETLGERGYVFAWPVIVRVHTIDLRPMQVSISANQRVLNAKLVRFLPEGLELFVSWHGRDNYKGPGNASQNGATATTTFSEILKSYAYDESGRVYPFLKIETVLKPEGVGGGGTK